MPSKGTTLEDRLAYDADNQATWALYAPGANWRNSSEYPPLKPIEDFKRDDYLRLAWELLRRMPRYRRQHLNLAAHGIRPNRHFDGRQGGYHFSSDYRNSAHWKIPGAFELQLGGHVCSPKADSNDQTFAEYVEARENADQDWFVMSRRRWLMDLWGLTGLPRPNEVLDADSISDLFAAPASFVTPVGTLRSTDRPRSVKTYVRQNEVLVRLRLDAPFELQRAAIQAAFEQAQAVSLQRADDPLQPLARTGAKLPGKTKVEFAADGKRNARLEASLGKSLLKQLDLCPFWLRTWDAVQEKREEDRNSGKGSAGSCAAAPRIDRRELLGVFIRDVDHGAPLSNAPRKLARPKKSADAKSVGPSFAEVVHGALYGIKSEAGVASPPNWRDRSLKYIEGSDEAYRRIIATAFRN
ncbi:hypothetical protein [Roseateles sp.]|uniref:hypothetical protein n=1 Tax=Roseateles sp. TaxID=1971397 RepID=UPI003BA3E86A